MRNLFRILNYARPLGFFIPQYLILIVFSTAFSVVNLTALIPLLQVLFDQVSFTPESPVFEWSWSVDYFRTLFYRHLKDIIDENGKLSALYFICLLVVISVLLANLFRYLSQVLLANVRVQVIQNLRNEAFKAISNFDLEYFVTHKKGDLISRITVDVQEVEQSVVSSLKILIKEPFLIIGYFVALLSISPRLTLYTLVLIPVAGMAVSVVARKIRKWARKTQQSLGKINGTLDETLSGMRIIKAFGAAVYVRNRFAAEVQKFAKQSFNIAMKSNLSAPISEILGVGVLVVVLVIGGKQVLGNDAELGAATFIGFLVIFSQLLNPAKAISVASGKVSRGISAAERVFELIDLTPKIKDKSNAQTVSGLNQCISFHGVSFSFSGQQVLHQVNFHIPKGKTIALVGPSGSGKSTIADLICRFYDPGSGAISWDGVNLKDLTQESFRAQIGMVSQEAILFNDTVAANIAFGHDTMSKEEIIMAAKIANAHDFIQALPEGYDAVIGERGNALSGGERQRLTIARAILKDPQLLILDEATSSLDAKSEEMVQEALIRVMKGRTCLIIAHRLSTVQWVDEILVLENGKIIEQGSHVQLVEKNGLYNQLTTLQSF